jgi:hypothetical protein
MVIYQEIARFGFMALILAISYYGIGRTISHWSVEGAQAIFHVLR